LVRELEIYAELPGVQGRDLTFVYFGGGTPSYISARHLRQFVARAQQCIPWDSAREVAFECEPGTLTRAKLEAIKEIGVTRLSLGIENLNDEILASNGRAHRSQEIYQVMPWIRELEFEQLNVDLIAGMVGESWESWKQTVSGAIALEPDSVTIYQMELPHNTVYSKEMAAGSQLSFADWDTKRAWHAYAMEQFEEAGFAASSAYTMTRAGGNCEFVYRDAVWQSSDMIGTGVASFSHMGGVHFQNLADWDPYLEALQEGRLPLARGFVTDAAERLTREFILQLKVGRLHPSYFQEKFGVDIVTRFLPVLQDLKREGQLDFSDDLIELTRSGLLQADQLLPAFYDLKYRNARYT
jgi:oxygen-independent coproporphyrinogen-3 oxidase